MQLDPWPLCKALTRDFLLTAVTIAAKVAECRCLSVLLRATTVGREINFFAVCRREQGMGGDAEEKGRNVPLTRLNEKPLLVAINLRPFQRSPLSLRSLNESPSSVSLWWASPLYQRWWSLFVIVFGHVSPLLLLHSVDTLNISFGGNFIFKSVAKEPPPFFLACTDFVLTCFIYGSIGTRTGVTPWPSAAAGSPAGSQAVAVIDPAALLFLIDWAAPLSLSLRRPSPQQQRAKSTDVPTVRH